MILDRHSSPAVVSMMDGDLFDKLEHVARSFRDGQKPFGGMQVCTCCVILIVNSLIM
jgi:hypothetical protein